MRLARMRSSEIAMFTVCACAIASLALLNRSTWRDVVQDDRQSAERWIAKYQELRPWLPDGEAAKFLVDESHADCQVQHPDARWYLAQYALLPKHLTRQRACNWVVVDSDCPDTPSAEQADRAWTLVADLRNGVRLYRVDARK